MVILHFLLAHLLGDFVFQPNALIKKKYKTVFGTFEHVVVIFIFTTLMLLPYWNQLWAWISLAILFLVHFTQDAIKVECDKKAKPKDRPFLFFLDQVLHVSLILVLATGFKTLEPMALPGALQWFYFTPSWLIYLIGSILLTFTWDITAYQFVRSKKLKSTYVPHYASMASRFMVFSLLFIVMTLLKNV